MKNQNTHRIYIRNKHSGGKVWWIQHNRTNKRESLRTTDEEEARQILAVRNASSMSATFHRELAKAHLRLASSDNTDRTWQQVMDHIIQQKKNKTKARWERAIKSRSFDSIRTLKLVNTNPEHFLQIFNLEIVSANKYLKELQNHAYNMRWILEPVINSKHWPQYRPKEKRAITEKEHFRIIGREQNPERKAFYEMCWHTGGAQTDVANLTADDFDRVKKLLKFKRCKTGTPVTLKIGPKLEELLINLPQSGKLFPYLSSVRESDRATEFKQRCEGLGIQGITLHSYRYAWAERALSSAYPMRFAMSALGHTSKAVARAYAKNANVEIPSLEGFVAGSDKSNKVDASTEVGKIAA